MKAEIIAVGTELLLGQINNTNTQWLSQRCAQLGLSVYHHQVVGDNLQRLVEAIQLASLRSEFVICTGGLGPTEDDITREALAKAHNIPLQEDEAHLAALRKRFSKFGGEMPVNNLRQAMLPLGAMAIPNELGTAPGVWYERKETTTILLPGPPQEMMAMFNKQIVPKLIEKMGSVQPIVSRSLRLLGIGESKCAERLNDIIRVQQSPTIAIYAHLGEIEIRLTAKGLTETQAKETIRPVECQITRRLARFIYGFDDDTLPKIVARLLLHQGKRIAIAESCTGGLLSAALTQLPGSSQYFERGIICYSNQSKQELCHVSPHIIEKHGAVSEACAIALAQGLLETTPVDITVSISGIAGPDGGTDEKPVGTVFMAVATPNAVKAEQLLLHGDRHGIQQRAVKHALNLLRLSLEATI